MVPLRVTPSVASLPGVGRPAVGVVSPTRFLNATMVTSSWRTRPDTLPGRTIGGHLTGWRASGWLAGFWTSAAAPADTPCTYGKLATTWSAWTRRLAR